MNQPFDVSFESNTIEEVNNNLNRHLMNFDVPPQESIRI